MICPLETIRGKGVTGTSSNISADDLIAEGKVGQAIYLHDGNRIILNSSKPECFCNFDLCNGTLSVSLWVQVIWNQQKSTKYHSVLQRGQRIGYTDREEHLRTAGCIKNTRI